VTDIREEDWAELASDGWSFAANCLRFHACTTRSQFLKKLPNTAAAECGIAARVAKHLCIIMSRRTEKPF